MQYDNLSIDGRVGFITKGHKYVLLDNPNFKFKSVTTHLKNYHEAFDAEKLSQDVSVKEGSDWFGMDPADIRQTWLETGRKASGDGTTLHSYGEDLLNQKKDVIAPTLTKAKWIPEIVDDLLINKQYTLAKTELLVYSEVLALAGQSDIILKKKWHPEDEDFLYSIYDWKFLSKPIEKKSFFNPKTRQYKKMFHPFHHLLDCNWIHYSIQLAIYQTMTGDPGRVKEKVLIAVYDDGYEYVPCYPMRVFWDNNNQLQAVYETFNGKFYDSRTDTISKQWPANIVGR